MFELIKQKIPSLTSIAGSIVAIVVVLGVYGIWQFVWPSISINKLGTENLSGRLVYSGMQKAGELAPKTYSLILDNNDMKVVNESKRFKVLSSNAVEFATSSNSKDFFFMDLAFDNSSGTSTVVKRVMHAIFPDTLEVVTRGVPEQYGTMSWSPNLRMLALSIARENLDGQAKVSTLNWKVLLTNESGEVQLEIPDAANPVWMPNSNLLLYLQSDGIYAYDTLIGAEQRVLSFLDESEQPFSAVVSIMFEVSPDGRKLVLTTPGTGNISVYEVSATMDVTKLYSRENQSVNYSWPVVSPDGMSYAVIARDIVDGAFANPRIEFYPISDEKQGVIGAYPLNGFNPSRVYLDDWVSN